MSCLAKLQYKKDKMAKWLEGIQRRAILPEEYIISYKNPKKEYWDLFVLILAFQNSLLIPIDLAFAPLVFSNVWYQIFDNIVDCIFLIDMIIMFFTSY